MKAKHATPVRPTLADDDRLLHPNDVKAALGFRCQTNHVLRNLEKRGLLFPVRLGTRTLRYCVADVRAFIAKSKAGAV